MAWREVIAFLIAVIWFIAVARLQVLNEWHHFIIGAWAYIGGAWMGVEWLAWTGLAICFDDTAQHVIQCWRPAFRSPLFRLYAWMYPALPKWLRL